MEIIGDLGIKWNCNRMSYRASRDRKEMKSSDSPGHINNKAAIHNKPN